MPKLAFKLCVLRLHPPVNANHLLVEVRIHLKQPKQMRMMNYETLNMHLRTISSLITVPFTVLAKLGYLTDDGAVNFNLLLRKT